MRQLDKLESFLKEVWEIPPQATENQQNVILSPKFSVKSAETAAPRWQVRQTEPQTGWQSDAAREQTSAFNAEIMRRQR